MYWFKASLLLLFAVPAWAIENYVIGGGIDADSADGLAGAVFADLGVTEKTRLYGSFGKSNVPLPRDIELNTSYGDIGIDHWFDSVGVSTEIAYWGDSEIFDSVDWRGSLYWRGDTVTVSANLEYRDFEFDIFRADFVTGRDIRFHAKGAGLSAIFRLNDTVSLNLSGIDYNYSAELRLDANRDIVDFLSLSRLSLINSLVEYRVGVGLGLDVGKRRWDLEYATWKGAVDGGTTHSVTVSILTPLSKNSDIQFGLGVDDSDTYDSITFFSIHVVPNLNCASQPCRIRQVSTLFPSVTNSPGSFAI